MKTKNTSSRLCTIKNGRKYLWQSSCTGKAPWDCPHLCHVAELRADRLLFCTEHARQILFRGRTCPCCDSPASWRGRGRRHGRRCGQCSVRGGRGGTSLPQLTSPWLVPRTLAWRGGSAAWTGRSAVSQKCRAPPCGISSLYKGIVSRDEYFAERP